MALVEIDKEALNDGVAVSDDVLDALPLVLTLADGVNDALVDTVMLVDGVEVPVALIEEEGDAVAVPLVFSDLLRLTDNVPLPVVLNDNAVLKDGDAVSLAVAVLVALMLALAVTLEETLADREVLAFTELLEDGDGIKLGVTDGVLVALDDRDHVGEEETVGVSLNVRDSLGVLLTLCVVVGVMVWLVLVVVESVEDCDVDSDELLVMELLSEDDGDALADDDKEPLSDQV